LLVAETKLELRVGELLDLFGGQGVIEIDVRRSAFCAVRDKYSVISFDPAIKQNFRYGKPIGIRVRAVQQAAEILARSGKQGCVQLVCQHGVVSMEVCIEGESPITLACHVL